MIPSYAAIELLKSFEQGPNGGFAPNPYLCPAGRYTVGWGHVIKPGEKFQFPLSSRQAGALLYEDLKPIASKIAESLRNHPEVTQSMFDALVCLGFNIGLDALLGSTLMSCLRLRQWQAAAYQFLRWDKARNPKTRELRTLAGLSRRRKAELELFLRDGFPSE